MFGKFTSGRLPSHERVLRQQNEKFASKVTSYAGASKNQRMHSSKLQFPFSVVQQVNNIDKDMFENRERTTLYPFVLKTPIPH